MEENKAEFQSKDQVLAYFESVTNFNTEESIQLLEQHKWNLNNALQEVYEKDNREGGLVNNGSQHLTSLFIRENNDRDLAEAIHCFENGLNIKKDTSSVVVMDQHKRIGFVGDNKNTIELIECLRQHRDILVKHKLYSFGKIGVLLEKELKLSITKFERSPLDGDKTLKEKIISYELDILIFFIDLSDSHSNTADVQELLRLADEYGFICAMNAATVDFLFGSNLMNESHVRKLEPSEAQKKTARSITTQRSYDVNLHLFESIENVCVWLEQNGLKKYCSQFRDNQIDEMTLFTDDHAIDLLCRNITDKNDCNKFIQARKNLLNTRIYEPKTPDLEIASIDFSKANVQTIVTNNFIRYGQNNQEVMTGSSSVVKIPGGVYTAADLCRLWHDNYSAAKEMNKSDFVKIIRNVQWRHKSKIGQTAEAGELIFPANFDGNLPAVIATTENLKYYGCSFADENQIKVPLSIEHTARVYTYNPNYVQEWVLGKNGPGLERHDFTHFDLPLTSDSGWFVLGKFNDPQETELHLTAFVIPKGRTLLVPSNIIHSNDYLKNEWRTLLATADIDRVLLKRQRHAGMALQPFAFDFPPSTSDTN